MEDNMKVLEEIINKGDEKSVKVVCLLNLLEELLEEIVTLGDTKEDNDRFLEIDLLIGLCHKSIKNLTGIDLDEIE